ncbi:MAG: CHRD domain-containing protein [bacterium]
MLTNAARKEKHPCAPRSFSHRRVIGAALLATMSMLASTGCGSDGATSPENASYLANLSGSNEIPPRASEGSGTARFVLKDGMATYEIAVSNLSGAATLVHILIGGGDVVGLVIARLSLVAPTGVISSGALDLRGPITFNNTTISGDSLRSLFENGNAYVNVYTATYPGGEVRGQIGRTR